MPPQPRQQKFATLKGSKITTQTSFMSQIWPTSCHRIIGGRFFFSLTSELRLQILPAAFVFLVVWFALSLQALFLEIAIVQWMLSHSFSVPFNIFLLDLNLKPFATLRPDPVLRSMAHRTLVPRDWHWLEQSSAHSLSCSCGLWNTEWKERVKFFS